MGKKMGRPQSDRDDRSVKLDRGLVDKAQLVARSQGITLAEYLTELMRSPVEKAYRQCVKAMASEITD
jgi:hypothetical protein